MKNVLWNMVRPALVAWLRARALRLPKAKATLIATQQGISIDAVYAINDLVVDEVIGQIEGTKKL